MTGVRPDGRPGWRRNRVWIAVSAALALALLSAAPPAGLSAKQTQTPAQRAQDLQ